MKIERIYIVGPCAAESREQVLETARSLSAIRSQLSDPFIFRAGVWKPRTSPNTFQGAGEAALEWLKEVKERYGLPVATEVVTPQQVEQALQAGIDYVWIGARTSANPIAVQAIAEEIKNLKLKIKNCSLLGVFIKNPVNADAGLWLGNIERLEQTGLPVMAIHRGCNHEPHWAMAHEVRRVRPDIPMLLDPSHMSGDARQVPTLMGKIEELGLDGAMVEVHCDPQHALSDAKQQVRPLEISQQLTANSQQPTTDTELNWLRAEIDELDARLWNTLAARMDVSRRIGEWKKEHGVAPYQPERYKQILTQRIQWAEEQGLNSNFIEQLWNNIHEESLRQQQ